MSSPYSQVEDTAKEIKELKESLEYFVRKYDTALLRLETITAERDAMDSAIQRIHSRGYNLPHWKDQYKEFSLVVYEELTTLRMTLEQIRKKPPQGGECPDCEGTGSLSETHNETRRCASCRGSGKLPPKDEEALR